MNSKYSAKETSISSILNSDLEQANSVAQQIVEFVTYDLGLDAEDVIPGLMVSTVTLALLTPDPRQALDEAVKMLEEPEEDLAQEGISH